jgi:hypothetical protein
MAHNCHPKLHRRLTLGGSLFQVSPGKKEFARLHHNAKKTGTMHKPIILAVTGRLK